MNPAILSRIRSAVEEKRQGDNTPYRSISVERMRRLSEETGQGLRQLEITALKNGMVPERYARNMKTLSPGDQVVLLESSVSIVGLGGLGGSVAEILARIGVGTLRLIDGDVFEDSNLNRQLVSRESLMGVPKAEAAEKRIRQINSSVTTHVRHTYLSGENARLLLADSCLAVDCLDSVHARFDLERTTKEMSIPLVSAAVAGVYGQITTIFPEDRGLSGIYGQPENAAVKGIETALGNLPTIVSLVASLECAEVSNVLLGRGVPLRNKLLIIDLSDYSFETVQLA